MLDSSQGFAELFSGSGKLSSMQLQSLARLLKPFLLRRTKEQVLPELPGKTENTVYCVLEDDQRKEYDQLAAFYRDSLQKKIDTSGFAKSRMHVLEALLRLRQLACHPGLIDDKRVHEPSAKLDLLEEQLDEVMASGRKALVFSQFTSMLAIVRARLDAKGIPYEYLDGATTDRKARVEHFQTDEKVKVFLISLKAGGVGLNLTAADYCFILDPWWNPASEAQAIDRAHRIGQKNHVFAYRLIARGTVEEKILALQASKRQLVEGIIANDGDVLGGLTAKDLDFLLE
jgi:SNF2 family DNA or RNA helicase